MGLFKIPKREEIDIQSVIAKTREEFKPKIVIKGTSLIAQIQSISQEVKQKLGKYKDDFLCITDDKELLVYVKQAISDGIIAIDTETTGLEYKDQSNLVGVCIQSNNQKPAYIPYGHISVVTESLVEPQVSKESLVQAFKLIADSKAKLIWHNAYYDLVVIYLFSGIWLWVDWDTMIAGWLLNENESHSLKDLYAKYILEETGKGHKFIELFEGITFCYVPYNVGYLYGAHDAEMTLALYNFQKPYLTKGTQECKECDLEQSVDILTKMELPLVLYLAKMRVNGIHIDSKKAGELKVKYEKLKADAEIIFNNSLESVKSDIENYNSCHREQIPYPVNFNSPQQLAVLFYDILKIGIIDKKNPRGTGKSIVESIVTNSKFAKHPIYKIAKALTDIKTFDKLLGSFIDKLPCIAKEYEGKIHCGFNQLGAATGRFASSNPRQLGIYDVNCI